MSHPHFASPLTAAALLGGNFHIHKISLIATWDLFYSVLLLELLGAL